MFAWLIWGVALCHVESLTQSAIEIPGAVLGHVEFPTKRFFIHVVQSTTPGLPESTDFNARQFYESVLFGNLNDLHGFAKSVVAELLILALGGAAGWLNAELALKCVYAIL